MILMKEQPNVCVCFENAVSPFLSFRLDLSFPRVRTPSHEPETDTASGSDGGSCAVQVSGAKSREKSLAGCQRTQKYSIYGPEQFVSQFPG